MCSTQGQDADLLGAIATWRKWPVFGYAMLQSWQGGQSLTTLARFTSQKQVGPNPAKSRASLRVGALDRIPRTGGEGRILTEHRVKLCPRRWVSVALTGFYPFFFFVEGCCSLWNVFAWLVSTPKRVGEMETKRMPWAAWCYPCLYATPCGICPRGPIDSSVVFAPLFGRGSCGLNAFTNTYAATKNRNVVFQHCAFI